MFLCSSVVFCQSLNDMSFTKKSAIEKTINDNKPLHILLEGNVDSIKKNLSTINGIIKYTSGNICAAIIPNQSIIKLINNHKNYGISSIGYDPDQGMALNDMVSLNNNIDSVHKGLGGLVKGYDGTDVIIGFIDTGIDFNHPDFKNNNGSSRILYIWDQNFPQSSKSPKPYNYGSEWTSQDINSSLCTHDDDATYNGHGSHVSGIACGNGRATNNFSGVAPKSDIIMVASNLTAPNWSETVADGVHYIFAKADALGKPCVVNISTGTMNGSHDARDLPAKLIDNLVSEKNGRAVVSAVGNSGNLKFHLSYKVNADTSFTWFNYNNLLSIRDYTPNGGIYFELYADTADLNGVNFSVGVDRTNPYSRFMATKFFNIKNRLNKIVYDTLKKENDDQIALISTWAEERQGVYILQVLINPDSISDYKWRFSAVGNGKFDIWSNKSLMGTSDIETNIPSKNDFPEILNYRLPDNYKTTLSSWACSQKVITVGNYVNKNSYIDFNGALQTLPETPGDIAGNSSIGPTRTGELKPEITASGSNVYSCGRLATLKNWEKTNPSKLAYGGMHYKNGGSSMASAIVSGIVALYFQKCPNTSYIDAKNAILNTAYQDNFTTKTTNYTWGYGKINAMAALQTTNFKIDIANSGKNIICSGDSIILSGPSSFQKYKWTNGDSLKTTLINSSGDYNLIVQNEKGCESKSQTIKITANPSPDKPQISQSGNILLASKGNFYQWYKDYQAINNATEQVYEVKENGVFTVEAINNYFCGTMSDNVIINNTNVKVTNSQSKIEVFPNPFKTNFFIVLSKDQNALSRVEVTNIIGQTIITQSNLSPDNIINLNLENQPKGVYLLKLFNQENLSETRKLIKD